MGHVGCPESHPYAYDNYGNYDYCCAHDPSQDPDSDYCVDDTDQMQGQACGNPPCDNHPSVVPQEVDSAKGLIFRMIS